MDTLKFVATLVSQVFLLLASYVVAAIVTFNAFDAILATAGINILAVPYWAVVGVVTVVALTLGVTVFSLLNVTAVNLAQWVKMRMSSDMSEYYGHKAQVAHWAFALKVRRELLAEAREKWLEMPDNEVLRAACESTAALVEDAKCELDAANRAFYAFQALAWKRSA